MSTVRASEIPVDARNAIGKLYAAWIRLGKKPSEFEELLDEAGYSISRPSLNRWRTAIESGHLAVNVPQNPGPIRILDDKKEHMVVGHVIKKNEEGDQVTIFSTNQFIKNNFGTSLSPTSIRRLFAGNRISLHLGREKQVLPKKYLAEEYRRWVVLMRKMGVLRVHKSKIGSMDFTYTNHRTARRRSYSCLGG